jgi:macrolide transport system ATP-binding/permease protein
MVRLTLLGVSKAYPGEIPVQALEDVTLTIGQGDYVAIQGPSGSGKSTLLNLLALLDRPTAGTYLIDHQDATRLDDAARARHRSATFAFVFQSFHLLDGRTVLDNVALGTLYRGLPLARRTELAREALTFVGLDRKADQRAQKLSGGERQRVAIARAIASSAPVVVADEPTGNLDSASGALVMDTLERLNDEGATVIVVTHDPGVAARAGRRLHMRDGRVSEAPAPPSAMIGENASPRPRPPEGRDATVRIPDMLRDAWRGLWTRAGRTLALVAAVALGVGLALTTTGLSDTARYQVSDIFDAQRNQWVSMTATVPDSGAAADQAASGRSLARVRALAGVDAAAVLLTHEQVTVSTGLPGTGRGNGSGTGGDQSADLVGVVGGSLPEELMTVDTQGEPLASLSGDEVLIGSQLADRLQLGPLLASPAILVAGEPRRVVGILEDAGLQIGLLDAVLTTEDAAGSLAGARYATALIHVQSGAAAQVAGQAPAAWIPSSTGISVDAPPDPHTMREQIEGNVTATLLTLTGVTLLAAMLSLANSMTTAVLQRTGEFGLRRAIGARRAHVTVLVLTESVAVGVLGGIAGAYISLLAVLGVTIARQWQPVFDPALVPVGIAAGVLVGLLGGLVAVQRASRIQPADALRA